MKKEDSQPYLLTRTHSILHFLITRINAQSSFVVLFILFAANFLTFVPDANEEVYLQVSKQYINPQWIPNSFNLTEFAGARVLYVYLSGFLLEWTSFEMVTFTGRLFIIFWLSWSMSALLKKTTIPNTYTLFLLQIIFFSHQSLFGGENFLLGFEPKHIAYGFLFFALGKLIEQKYIQAILLITIATWFHILVGGWFFLAFLIYLFFTKEVSFKQIILSGIAYGILLSPLVWNLIREILLKAPSAQGALTADWIYCYFRHPHHTAIFYSMDYFYHHHAAGVLWTVFIAIVTIAIYPRLLSPTLLPINKLTAVISCLLLVNVVLAFFDKEGHFVKFYPFRLASIDLWLFYLLTFSIIVPYFARQESIQKIIIIATLMFFIVSSSLNLYKMVRFIKNRHAPFYEMTDYIKTHTPVDAIVYFDDETEDYTYSFIRKSERDRFVMYKFVPSATDNIYIWYDRILIQDKIKMNPSYIFEAKKKYKIDYALTKDSIRAEGWAELKVILPYRLYRLN